MTKEFISLKIDFMSINWSEIRNDSLWGKALRVPLRLLPKTMVMSIRKGPGKGLKWIVGSATHGCWVGTYELEKQLVLERFVKSGMIVYDIGAQAGFYSLLFSRLVQNQGKVYAIEPFAENVKYLLKHIQLNQVKNLKVIQGALSDQVALAGFSVDEGKCENSILEGKGGLLLVPIFTLDELIKLGGLDPPHVMKIDVEGAEVQVLHGASLTLKTYKPILFLALHGREQREKCYNILWENNYQIFNLKGIILDRSATEDEIYAVSKG